MIDASLFPIPPSDCTLSTCSLAEAQIEYIPSLAGNAFFVAVFGLLLVAHIFLGVRYRTWGVLVGMVAGNLLEIAGYTTRIMLHFNPFKYGTFDTQLICLTLAPAFMTAAIYLCLGRIVVVQGQQHSRLKPMTYTVLFVGCDLLSLVLQSVGGALAATANTKSQADRGVNIMIAGLASQVASLLVFMGLWADFSWRVRHAAGKPGSAGVHHDDMNAYSELSASFRFRAFKTALWTASICVIIRCIYRVVELHAGFASAAANNEVAFMILEGPLIIVASGAMAIFHPGCSFNGQWKAASRPLREKHSADNRA